MIVVVAPEAATWVGGFPGAVVFGPGAGLAERAVGLYGRGSVARRLEARFAWRRGVDHLAARWLPGRATRVVAPALGARRVLAEARRRGIRTTLVEDLPALRQLHEDLDRAAQAHPGCAFLRNHRAPAWVLARQEQERVLADEILVRGRHAAEVRERLGFRAVGRAPGEHVPAGSQRPGGPRILLAGLACARAGANEALEALPAGATLLVRTGEGTEPRDLLSRPGVREATAAELALDGVDVVIAPTWVEAWPREVPLAVKRGTPVIATRRAAGWCDVTEVPVGDAGRLAEALISHGI